MIGLSALKNTILTAFLALILGGSVMSESVVYLDETVVVMVSYADTTAYKSNSLGSATPKIINSGSSGRYMLMQMNNFNYLGNGRILELQNGDLKITPVYADNIQLIPLRAVAEYFGYDLRYDDETQSTLVYNDADSFAVTAESSVIEINELAYPMQSPAVVLNSSTYIPVSILNSAFNLYTHIYGADYGELLLISDFPVSEMDILNGTQGAAPEAFSYEAPDPGLLVFQELGIKMLGPALQEFVDNTLFMKCGSEYAVFKGKTIKISPERIMPRLTTDGYLFIPLVFSAESFGINCRIAENESVILSTYEGEFIYSAETGITKNGEAIEAPMHLVREIDGTLYITAQAFKATTGILYYPIADTKSLILSKYDLSKYSNLSDYAYSTSMPLATFSTSGDVIGYIALTFDDGPSGEITNRLLDGLKERNAHATFFLCNYRIGIYPGPMNRYIDEGHEVGNHSSTHTIMTSLSQNGISSEIDNTNSSISSYYGQASKLFRPPGGAYNEQILAALSSRGMSCIMWSLDTIDWKQDGKEKIVERVVASVKDGDIVLMHDMYNATVDAALDIIDRLQAQGYCFVTVSELAQIKGRTITPGEVYYSIK